MSKKNFLSEAVLKNEPKTVLRFKLKESSITTEKIADDAITTEKLKDKSITAEKISDGIIDEIAKIAAEKAAEGTFDEFLTKNKAKEIYQPKIKDIYSYAQNGGINYILDEDGSGHGQEIKIPYVSLADSRFNGGVITIEEYNKFNQALQFEIGNSITNNADNIKGSGIYPNISVNGPITNETFLVQSFQTNSSPTGSYYSTQIAIGVSNNVIGKVYIRYIYYNNGEYDRKEWILLSNNSSASIPTGYTVTYNTNGHGTTPTKLTNVTKLPSPLPTLSATGYTFDGWYTNSALTTKAVAGSTITSDTTLYAKWTLVTGYTVTYNANGHGSTPTKLTNVTKLPSTLPTLSASGYTFGGWYTDSALTIRAVAGSTISSNITLYAKWTKIASVYMYTGNTATTPTDEEILQGTKYDYNTTKSFTTPQMVLRSIWVCLPATVTLVSMENVNFSGDFIINTNSGINKLSTKSLTIEGVQYTLYYLTTIPSKNPYKTIVK